MDHPIKICMKILLASFILLPRFDAVEPFITGTVGDNSRNPENDLRHKYQLNAPQQVIKNSKQLEWPQPNFQEGYTNKRAQSKGFLNYLPRDLKNIFRKLGINVANLNVDFGEIAALLGTTSFDETLRYIRKLASTADGLELIESFLRSYVPSKPTVSKPLPKPSHKPLPRPPQYAQPKFLPQAGSLVDRAHTDLDILKAVASEPEPDSGFLKRFTSWISSFLPGNKKGRGLNKKKVYSKDIYKPSNVVYIVNPLPLPQMRPAQYSQQKLYTYVPEIYRRRTNTRYPTQNHIQPSWIQPSNPQPTKLPFNQLSKFPLSNENRYQSKVDSYGQPITPSPAFQEEDILKAASETELTYVIPEPDLNETGVKPTEKQHKAGRTDNWTPKRASGLHGYATGKIHKIDSKAIDAAINAKYHPTDDSNIVVNISALTSSQFAPTPQNASDELNESSTQVNQSLTNDEFSSQ